MKTTISTEEYISLGTLGCQGCGGTLAMRYALKALGKNTILTLPACCWSVIDGPYPYSAIKVPLFHCAFETAASTASGIAAGLKVKGKNTTVVAWAGDGGTADIGIQALSGVAERNDNIIYICYDNEAYMNTGGQRSSATLYGAITTTTPYPFHKKEHKKNMPEIMAAHGIPYIATANIAYPEDLIAKVKKANSLKGTKYLQILAPCPTGWLYEPALTIKIARLATETNVYLLYEVEYGKYKLRKNLSKKPIEDYLALQGRFRYLTNKEIKIIQDYVNMNYEHLIIKEKLWNS